MIRTDNLTRDFGNRVGTQHTAAFAMVKIVVNKSDKTWHTFPRPDDDIRGHFARRFNSTPAAR